MVFLRVLSAVISLALLAGIVPATQAQIPGAESVAISIFPQYPKPYDIITITPSSTLIDLSASTVTISVDGSVISEGSGTQGAQTQVGGAGTRTLVRVSARDASGQTHTKEMSIRPADVALVIEPVSTSHPFYKGGTLVAPEGRVRLVAVADFRTAPGTVVPTASLVYTWKNGDRILQDQSGIGRSVLDATAPVRYRDARISLTVTTQDRSIVGSAVVTVSPVDPIVRVYPESPLLGALFESAITSTAVMTGTEDTFRAVGYFFASPPVISWTINGARGETGPDITVRITEPGEGTARIGVEAEGHGTARSATYAFPLQFGSASSGGIFGL